jgi:hypothetical protein
MAKPLPLPKHEPDSRAREIMAMIDDYARAGDTEDTTQEARLLRLSSTQHLWIAAEAAWERTLAEAKSQNNQGWLGWKKLMAATGMALATMQTRITERPAARRAFQAGHNPSQKAA